MVMVSRPARQVVKLPPLRRMRRGDRSTLVLAPGEELRADSTDLAACPGVLAQGPCEAIADVAVNEQEGRVTYYWRVAARLPVGEAAEVLHPPDAAWLQRENERLRADNARLGAALDRVQDALREAQGAASVLTPAQAHGLLALARSCARRTDAIGVAVAETLDGLGLPRTSTP